jgi:hypothetical protein
MGSKNSFTDYADPNLTEPRRSDEARRGVLLDPATRFNAHYNDLARRIVNVPHWGSPRLA